MRDHFVFHGHLCIVFEMLGANLYELIKTNQFRGISLTLLKIFAKQILDSLLVLRDASVIHCDLKPENILLTTSIHSTEIKLIDFGSACMENQTVYSYIQSRFYRSPEVVLGHPYTTSIDMWSFGCIAAELFLGLPLFPGVSEYDLMKRMIERLGCQPPDQILRTARNSSKYFKHAGNSWVDESQAGKGVQSAYQFLSESEYEAREKKKPVSGKRYFNHVRLEDVIFNYPYKKKMSKEELVKENQTRLSFIDFLRGLVHFDPVKRWTPRQAAQHPFVTEEPFTGPYRPFPEAPHMIVFREIMVDDNIEPSHCFGNSTFPRVVNMKAGIHYSSPQYHSTKFDHANSCGSLGGYGILGEDFSFANNCGCQGYAHIPVSYCPLDASALKSQEDGVSGDSSFGKSPKTYQKTTLVPHGHALGVSPLNGIFKPLSIGVSPSKLPLSSQVHFSPASPGKHFLTSPASGGIHSIALGRAAAVGPNHRRNGLGILESSHLSSEDDIRLQQKANHKKYGSANVDINMRSFSSSDCNSQAGYLGTPCGGHESSPLHPGSQRFGMSSHTRLSTTYDNETRASSFPRRDFVTTQGGFSGGGEKILPVPGPGVWYPNYNNDLFFQTDGSDLVPISTLGENIQSGQATCRATLKAGGACKSAQSYIALQESPLQTSYAFRRNGLIKGQSNTEGRPTLVHESQLGYMHSMAKNSRLEYDQPQQNSPSQMALQSSLFFEQQLQHPYQSQNNPGQHLPSNITGKHQTSYSSDLFSQSTFLSYSHFPVLSNHGCSLPSQKDYPAFYSQGQDFISASSGIHTSFAHLGTMAPHSLHLGKGNPLGTIPTKVQGTHDQ
ncbi:dual specificity protein kinase YAK1 homolog isoform X2 [Cryptomeria japonica]|nr:dual specificity protein kinase YAK1 homolog isoform X2 [Cryptomeria japonica]